MADSKRTPEQLARRLEYQRKRYADPAYRAQKNAKAREKYKADPELRERMKRAAKNRPFRECSQCHRYKMHQGHGLCGNSYSKRKRSLHYERSLAYEQRYRDRNRERERVRLRAYYAKTKVKQMVRAAQWRAESAGVPFDITEHDVPIPMFCPVLGIPIEQSSGRQSPNSPSLDRIIPERGYVRGNVRVISSRANTLKRDGTLAEFKALVVYLEARCGRSH